jgi:hypothetical protein
MARGSFIKTRDDIAKDLEAIAERGASFQSYFNHILYPLYQNAQIERWESQNATQGETWAPITPVYAKQKKKKFASYPGAGTVLMVATEELYRAARGEGNSLKMADDTMLRVSIDLDALPYAKYPGVMRPFMLFSDQQEYDWAYDATRYVMRGAS